MLPVNSDGAIESSTSQQKGLLLTGLVLAAGASHSVCMFQEYTEHLLIGATKLACTLYIPVKVCHQLAPLTLPTEAGASCSSRLSPSPEGLVYFPHIYAHDCVLGAIGLCVCL